MSDPRDPRACPWLNGRCGGAITISAGAWWLVLTKDPRATRYRTARNGWKLSCREEKEKSF